MVSIAPHSNDCGKVTVGGEGDGSNDLLFSCSHKTEFVTTVVQAASELLGVEIPLRFSDEMMYRFNSVYERKVTFREDGRQNAVHTKLSEPKLRQNLSLSSPG